MLSQSNNLRKITRIIAPKQKAEGRGATVYRLIGTSQLERLDPFLMLDYFQAKLPGGFPDHPHRGFETVTYMLSGSILHEDFKGNKGRLGPGDIQWMTAGKGIVHAEMPGSYDELSIGFQLWVNLDSKNKMCDAQYQEYKSEQIPVVQKDGVYVKIIAGESLGQKGIIQTKVPAMYIDVHLKQNVDFQQHIPKEYQGMIFVYEGNGQFGSTNTNILINQGATIDIEDNQILKAKAGPQGAKFILFAGKPIKEKVYSYGPFVLDSQSSLNSTFDDYQQGRNGFEGAHDWESEIQYLAQKK